MRPLLCCGFCQPCLIPQILCSPACLPARLLLSLSYDARGGRLSLFENETGFLALKPPARAASPLPPSPLCLREAIFMLLVQLGGCCLDSLHEIWAVVVRLWGIEILYASQSPTGNLVTIARLLAHSSIQDKLSKLEY